MTRNSALLISDALVSRARLILAHLQAADRVVMSHHEASDFAADLIRIAEAVLADVESAPVIDLTTRRRLRIALATPGDGDAA